MWRRALELVVDDSADDDKLRVMRTVSTLEERICNGVARRVLLPEMWLRELVTDLCISYGSGAAGEIVTAVARGFDVSWPLAFRSVAAIGHDSSLGLDQQLFGLLVGYSRKTGSGLGPEILRVTDFLWPNANIVQGARRPFVGMALSEFGRDLVRQVEGANMETAGTGSIDARIVMRHQERKNNATREWRLRLIGEWKRWGKSLPFWYSADSQTNCFLAAP
jgi:hypothetical protein